ncbi:UNVERIFIED_CONTAM: hypothetical protein PYX00_003077 [Menopon gallinae]|uniref:Protein PET100 homolog, mitochondrial n=1 Tax=Menopon gallinae TaxID=328185 RepID=A0AAW2HZ12_9NEOP
MGGWKLEAFRMAVYISFPVVMFHLFNDPNYFESSVRSLREEVHKRVDQEATMRIRQFQEEFRKKNPLPIEKELMSR